MKLYQVDAFTDQLFGGNPAAVVPLSEWLPDELMQQIAAENNLAETAFFVRGGADYHLRWFTPAVEVDLCGHATLATAHVLFVHLDYRQEEVSFQTKSGQLLVHRAEEGRYTMNFPADKLTECDAPQVLIDGIGLSPLACFRGRDDYMAVVDSQATVENLTLDFRQIGLLDARGVIVTAPGEEVDFVSRGFFTPAGIDEDPVTGSAHTSLTPYWSERLGKQEMVARQLSTRGGTVYCKQLGLRVELTGGAKTFMEGRMFI